MPVYLGREPGTAGRACVPQERIGLQLRLAALRPAADLIVGNVHGGVVCVVVLRLVLLVLGLRGLACDTTAQALFVDGAGQSPARPVRSHELYLCCPAPWF